MRINHHLLRALVESIILEGFKDDQRYLIEKYPDHAQDLSRLQPKWISWLTARFGENPRVKETHPFEDAIVTVLNFSKRDAAISEKYKSNEQFMKAVDEQFPPGERSWRSPGDVMMMTVDEMELVLGLSERKKQRIDIGGDDGVESDRVGKVGPWNLWMPTTRERSCRIAGYDPVTREPKTTWCTARMAGSNLFYNYVGRPGTDMTIFYIIRDDPSEVNDWLSLGFVNGETVLKGQDGGASVNRDNKGLTPEKLKDALGEYFDEIMQALTAKNKSLGGRHPAHDKIEDAARNVESLKYLTQGLSKKESEDIKRIVVRRPNVSSDVLAALSNDESEDIRSAVASSARTPDDVLAALSNDASEQVRRDVARNSRTPVNTLRKLADGKDSAATTAVENRNMPPEFLLDLLHTADERVQMSIIRNPNLPAEALARFARDGDWSTRAFLARNPRTPRAALEILLSDDSVRFELGSNSNLPADMLAQLASDSYDGARQNVAANEAAPPEILMKLARDKSTAVRTSVALNRNAPIAALQKLANDRSGPVKRTAGSMLAARQAELNESRLRQLIRRMI